MANEKRLIDANELGGFLLGIEQKPDTSRFTAEIIRIMHDVLNAMPTIDAVEVVHGRWMPNFEYDFDRGEHRLTGYNCDRCGIWTLKKSNYCPNCGTKMDGDGNA